MLGKSGVRVRTIVIFLLLLLAIVFVLPVASAATITVGPDRDYEYLQDAIDAARQWDVIEVYYNTTPYGSQSQIIVDKQVRISGIYSESDYSWPVISNDYGEMVVDSDDVLIEGLRFQYTEGTKLPDQLPG